MKGECSSPALLPVLSVVKKILNLFGIIVPILLIVMTSINLVSLTANPDNKKGLAKIKNSFLAAAIIFLIPVAVNTVMYMLDDSFTFSDCWNNAGEYSFGSSYVDPGDEDRPSIITNPGDYEGGGSGGSSSGSGSYEGTAQQVGDVVWDPNDVTKISNLTTTQLIAVLNAHGGKAKNFIPYASGLIATEHKYQVNVFFLLGIEALESGWLTSDISKKCNNLGGVCQSSAHPSNGCGKNSNCSFAYFTSVNEFIDYHGNMLHKNYLTPGGTYYHGATPSGVVVSYCPGCSAWPGSVTSIANSLFKHVPEVL